MSDQNDTTVDEPTTNEPTPAATTRTTAAPTATATSANDEGDRTRRKVRTGVVVSEKMDKTVLVRIDRKVRHRLYKKTVAKSSKLAVHDETNDAHVGDTVRVMETRPLSKTKRWRVIEIVERAK
jgi:small subunit ribosomal protein S17